MNTNHTDKLEQALKNLTVQELEGVLDALVLVAEYEERSKAMQEPDGLYLVPPYGELIASGDMKCFAKPRHDDRLVGDRILVSGQKAYGVMKVGTPVKVEVGEFDDLFGTSHQVSRKERLQWWPEKESLFLYPIEEFKAYDEPRDAIVPPGTQMCMGEIEFKGGPGSGNYGHEGRRGQRGGSAPASSPSMGNSEYLPHLAGISDVTPKQTLMSFQNSAIRMMDGTGPWKDRDFSDQEKKDARVLVEVFADALLLDSMPSNARERLGAIEKRYRSSVGHGIQAGPGKVKVPDVVKSNLGRMALIGLWALEQEYGDSKELSQSASLTISIARTQDQATKGFSGRDSIDPNEGLLIPLQPTTGIWMKDTFVPLTVAFLDSDYKVLSMVDLQPLDETVHIGPTGSTYALEASPSWFDSAKVEVGDVISLPN